MLFHRIPILLSRGNTVADVCVHDADTSQLLDDSLHVACLPEASTTTFGDCRVAE